MKYIYSFVLALLFFVSQTHAALSFESAGPQAAIESNGFAQAEKNIILNAASSRLRDVTGAVRYSWDFGDGTQETVKKWYTAMEKPVNTR